MGRRKIAIKKLEDKHVRYITFSKRRNGLYNKATEFCMVNDAQIAILALSPSHTPRAFGFGHPSPDAVIDAFLAGSAPVMVKDQSNLIPLYGEVKALEREATIEEQKQMGSGGGGGNWWESEDYKEWKSIDEVRAHAEALEQLMHTLVAQMNSVSSSSKAPD